MQQTEQNIPASVLDRLVDLEPRVSHEPVQYRLINIGQIKASVVRDLENLLNTKRHIIMPPAVYRQVNTSLFVYGLRDFSAQDPRGPSVKRQLRQDIEKTIARFEPRLKNVTVHLDIPTQNERNIRFRITGLLVVEPVAEPISFDTYFDASRGEYIISK